MKDSVCEQILKNKKLLFGSFLFFATIDTERKRLVNLNHVFISVIKAPLMCKRFVIDINRAHIRTIG